MPESFNEKAQSQEKPQFLNNFFLYLPGGLHRSYYGQNPEKDKIMDAIDKLLADEFSSVVPQEVFQNMSMSNQLVYQAFNSEQPLPESEEDRLLAEAKSLSKKADDAIRPIFERLVEMGFKKGLLMQ